MMMRTYRQPLKWYEWILPLMAAAIVLAMRLL